MKELINILNNNSKFVGTTYSNDGEWYAEQEELISSCFGDALLDYLGGDEEKFRLIANYIIEIEG